jgi:hypothetical protein
MLVVAALSFGAGFYARGYIATAENNKATVDAQNQKIDKEQEGNEKLAKIESKNAKRGEIKREVSSRISKNRGINGERTSCIVSPDSVRGINAIRGANDTRLNQ